ETKDEEQPATGLLVGTPPYMSPEQVNGDSDVIGPATDIYSLGVILYELLTGQHPYQAEDTQALLQQIIAVEPKPPKTLRRDLDEGLQAICMKAMSKKISNRYGTMEEFAAALTKYLKGSSTSRVRLKVTVP